MTRICELWGYHVGDVVSISKNELNNGVLSEETLNKLKLSKIDKLLFIVAGKEVYSQGAEMALIPIDTFFDGLFSDKIIYADLGTLATEVSSTTPETLIKVQRLRIMEIFNAYTEEPVMHKEKLEFMLEWCEYLNKIIKVLNDK